MYNFLDGSCSLGSWVRGGTVYPTTPTNKAPEAQLGPTLFGKSRLILLANWKHEQNISFGFASLEWILFGFAPKQRPDVSRWFSLELAPIQVWHAVQCLSYNGDINGIPFLAPRLEQIMCFPNALLIKLLPLKCTISLLPQPFSSPVYM